MTETYEKILKIEIINELHASIYAKILNYVLNEELDKNDTTDLHINFKKQLSIMKKIDLFKLSFEELEFYHDNLLALKKYADSITKK